jgi:threonyl-tRNA synthetase
MRVRGFTQDDAHVFCTDEQMAEECLRINDLILSVYEDFGFKEVVVKLSTRPDKRVGSDELWDRAESVMTDVLKTIEAQSEGRIKTGILPGEGAFYGPKFEYTLKDAIGRQWQCGTMQVDFSMPERLDAEYVGEDGARHRPVMLHRAIVGSMERFIGILIEQHAGALPAWLAPVQAVILNITDHQADYVKEIAKTLRNQGLRVETDLRNEKITYKIREHSLQKPPYLLVVGDKEKAAGAVAVRARGNKDLGVMSLQAFSERVAQDIASKS